MVKFYLKAVSIVLCFVILTAFISPIDYDKYARNWRCDVTGEGFVDFEDVLEVLEILNYNIPERSAFNKKYDVNNDGIVDIDDISMIIDSKNYSKISDETIVFPTPTPAPAFMPDRPGGPIKVQPPSYTDAIANSCL